MGVVGESRATSGAMLFWVLLGHLALVMGAHVSVFSDPTLLICGQESLQLTLPPGWEGNASFVLTTWDTEGKAHTLQNDSDCGLLVSGTPDGSRKVLVSYAGCYVFEWDGNYLILVGLEGTDADGQKVLHEETLLRCPVDLPALDAPSGTVCSAVPSQDRLLCASLPISQGDCEAQGCCYDPRDRVKPCYFGNTGKPEQLSSLPPELLQNRIPPFAGRAGLVCTTPAGGSGLCFCLSRMSCPSDVSSIFQCIATDLVLWPESLLLELVVLVLPCLALVLWVKGRTACRTCWPCLGCDVRASFPSLFCPSSRLIITLPPVTAHCTPDGQFSIAVSRDVTLPPVALDSVQLASGQGTGCVPVLKNNAFVVYQFPLSACGTTFQVTGDQAIYENELVASRDVKTGSFGSVTRDSIFRLHVRCSYSISGSSIPLSARVFTLPPLPAVSQPGPLSLELRVASDGSYTSYYTDSDYPVVKTLRDPVYAEVKLLQRTDPDLILVLHHCWATPSTNPQQQLQWPILVNGCPYAGDNYQTQLMPQSFTSGLLFPSHYQRFTLYTFTFVDSTSQEKLSGLVYLHCSASVCHQSVQESCTTTCPARVRGKRSAEHPFQEGTSHVSSKGPVIFLQDELRQDTAKDDLGVAVHAPAPWALGFAAVATGATLCVVLVISVLWQRKVSATHELNGLQ
ncbi:PREDICTED: zona pellucida sperm-binding protein 4 [Corvus brachyrhynchos]|uniref:zona pellucida sperm-binding protein 4 n=1 Tax=Corvus brachyrhynchos TaxID=85066 RepID=UPI0008166121|nr:PREDICTED: zona pellucida sperm-binding protein 4 [Corvus brachyrhynchos]